MNNIRSHSKLKTILLFDQEVQHYRQAIYRYFRNEFINRGYDLRIVYDKKLNNVSDDLFIGIDYTWNNFNHLIKQSNCKTIILFVWLRYTFLLPFMILQRLRGVKMITWSHGINLQNKNNHFLNLFYFTRQYLAHALIIFSDNESKYIKPSHKKLFVANNTLNFSDFYPVDHSKESLKEKYQFSGKKIVLCVGRMNTNNRKPRYLLEGFEKYALPDAELILVGPGVKENHEKWVKKLDNVHFFGAVYDSMTINELYKMSDVFCMPGAIGLAINHAFYYGLPVIVEDVDHGPEAVYLKEGLNGFRFNRGNVIDMMFKINMLLYDDRLRRQFSDHAKRTIREEASIEKMLNGFMEAINYVQ